MTKKKKARAQKTPVKKSQQTKEVTRMADGTIIPGGKPWLLVAEFDDVEGKPAKIDTTDQPPRWNNDNEAAIALSDTDPADPLKRVATRVASGTATITCTADASLASGNTREVTTTPFVIDAPESEAVSGKVTGSEMP
jgi:hypothetical protein